MNIVILGLSPILPHIVNALAVVSFSILVFYLFIRSKQKLKKSKILLINSSLYIVYLLSLFYTSNIAYATKHLVTALSLVVLPITFYFLGLSKILLEKELKKLFFSSFWIASVVYSFIIMRSFFTFSNPRYPFKDANFFRKASESIYLIGQHPIYTSLILSLAILVGLYYLFKINKRFKLIVFLGQALMTIILLLLMSKSILLSLAISSLMFLIFKLKDLKSIKIYRIIIACFLGIALLFVFLPQKNNRFYQLFIKDTFNNLDENNSTSIRVAIYNCAILNIKKAPFFGYGFGDVKDKLLSCYANKQSFMLRNRYNTHNQYLSIWLGMGIVGLLIFIYLILYNLKLMYLSSDFLGLSILILFAMVMFFENILERQTGVVLFAFILNLFGFDSSYKIKYK